MASWFGEGLLTDLNEDDIHYLTELFNRYVDNPDGIKEHIKGLFRKKITPLYSKFSDNPEVNLDDRVNAMLGMILYWKKQKVHQHLQIKFNSELHTWYGSQGSSNNKYGFEYKGKTLYFGKEN